MYSSPSIISRSRSIAAVLFLLAAIACSAQTDPNQINWKLIGITGADAPTQTCSSSNYGQPYQRTDVTPNKYGTCGADGWQYRGTVSSVVSAINGASGSFTFTGPAVSCSSTTCTFSSSSPINGTVQTGNYTITTAPFVQMNCPSACTVKLPATVSAGFAVAIMATGAGAVTIDPNGVTYDGATTIPTRYSFVTVWTDGTGYHSSAPITYGTGLSVTGGLGGLTLTAAGGGGGGYTNLTGSVSETTVAQINSAGASGTYYATTPLSIATGGTITVPVQFTKAGLWTIANGQVVTFSKLIKETDAPSQLFAGSGTVVLANGQDAPVEWFGAVGYTSQASAVSGTDSMAAINACAASLTTGNQCKLQQLFYRTTGALVFGTSGVGLAGVTNGGVVANGGSAIIPSGIVSTSTTADIIDVGSISAYIYNNKFNDFAIMRSAMGTSTSAGIRVIKCAGCIISHTNSNDSVYDYYLEGLPYYGQGVFEYNSALWGYNGFTPSGTRYGVYIDTTIAPQSTQLNYNQVANNLGTGTSEGFYCVGTGAGCTDIYGVGNQTAMLSRGVYVNSPSDFHWDQSTNDQCGTCIYVTGASANGSAIFNGGWAYSNTGYSVDIESTYGTTITGMAIRGSVTTLVNVNGSLQTLFGHNLIVASHGQNGIILTGSTRSNISGNNIQIGNSDTCINLTAGSNANSVTGNECTMGNTSAVGLALASSSDNTVMSNTFSAGGSTGITADASSSNNRYINFNTFNGLSTPFTDAGTGNQFSGGATLDANTVNTPQYVAGGGTANAQTVTLSPAVASQSAGLHVRWIPTAANTSTTTLAVNGLTAKNLTKCGTTALTAGDLATLTIAEATYDGTQYQLLNPQAVACTPSGGSGTVTTSGSPTSGDIAAFSGPTVITTATATQINTLIKTLSGCNTATFLYSPQSGTCVAPSGGGSGAMTNITGTVTVSGCSLINSNTACQVTASPGITTFSFSSIPGTYNSLQLRCLYQSGGSDYLQMYVNSDTTSTNYGFAMLAANSAASGNAAAYTNPSGFWTLGATTTTTSWATSIVVDIDGYANTTFFKTYHSASSQTNNGTRGQMIEYVMSGQWLSQSAITRMDFQTSSAQNILQGSQCSLYGIL
jgi:hypothetical protein